MTSTKSLSDPGLQGHYAGIVSRLLAFLVDLVLISLGFTLFGHVLDYVVSAVRGQSFELADHRAVADLALAVWAFAYAVFPLARSGRTAGMALLGLKAVRRDGSDLDGWHAFVRVLVFPLSFAIGCLGFVMILVTRERRALHDVIANTTVVYAWDAYAAKLRFLGKSSALTDRAGATQPPTSP